MDTSRLSTGDMIAGVSGAVLLIVLFLPWYGVDVNVAGFSATESANAWEALELLDILLFLIALVAIGVPLARAAGSMPDDVPGGLVVTAAGMLAFLLVLFRIIDLPTPDLGPIADDSIEFGRKFGIFLGLIATAGIAYGGWREHTEAEEGTTTEAATPPPAAPPPSPSTPA